MAVDPVFAARQRAIGTQLTLAQEQYLRTLAQRRRAFIHQISAKSPLAPPKPTHHGLLGSILHSVTDPVALAATQIGEDLAHIPGGMIDLGVNLTKDEIRLLHGRNPKYLPPMGKAYVQGIYEHVTHPTQNPGHLIMDFLPFASGAKGLLTRTTRGVTARSRALKGLPQIKAEEPHTIARHPLIKGYDDLKGEAKTNKAKAILAAQHEQVFESFPFVRPTPPRVRDVLIGKTGRVGKMFFPKKTAEAERAAPERALPIQINQEFHPNTLGQVAVSGRIRKTQFGLIRRPADWFQEGLLPKGAKGHIFTIETRPADYAQWEPMRYKPTDEEIAKATAEGVPAREIINQGAPLLLPVKGTDFEAAFRIFEDTVHEWTKGKSKFDLSIVRSSSSRSAAKKLGLIQSGGLEKEATAALAKALGQKGEKLTEENMPPELKGMGVPEMEALYTPDEIAYLFQKQRERKALAEAPAGSKVKQQLTKTVALHRGFRELKTSKEKAEASLDLAPFIANKKALTPQAAATVLGIRTKAAAEIIDLAKGHVRNAVKAGKYKELRAKLDEAHRARVRAKRGTYKTLAEAAAAVKVEEVPQKLKLVRKELPTEEVTAEERAAAQGLPELPPEHLTPAEKGYIFWERDFRNAPLKTKDFRDLRDEGIEKFGLSKADLAAIYKKPREPGIVAASAAKAAAEKPPSVLKTEAEMSKAVEEAKAQRVEERGGAVAKKPGPKPASASAAELASKLEPPKRAAPEEAAKPAAEAKKPAPSAELKPEKPVPKAKKPKQKIELKIELEDGTVYTKVVDKLPQHWGSVIQREVPHGKSLLGSKRSKRVLPTAEKVAPAKAAPEEAKPLTEEERTAITKKVTELPEAGRLTNLTNQQMGSGYTAWEQDFAEMAKKVPVGAKDVPVKFSDLIQEGKDAFKLKKKEIDILHQKAHEAAPTVKEVTGGKMGAKGSRLQRAGNALRFAKREGDPAKIAAAEKEFADAGPSRRQSSPP
jgi:Predicted membrane protein